MKPLGKHLGLGVTVFGGKVTGNSEDIGMYVNSVKDYCYHYNLNGSILIWDKSHICGLKSRRIIMNRKDLLEFFNANRSCHLATLEEGAPRVRCLDIYKADDEGILIQTWKSKDLSKQLGRNPEVEFCFNNYEDGIQIRVRGKMEPVEDAATKEQVLVDRPYLQKFVDGGQALALYRLKKGLAHSWTLQKNFEPKDYTEF